MHCKLQELKKEFYISNVAKKL